MINKSAVLVGVGASRGLGAAVARRFARENFRLVLMGRNGDKLNAAAKELRDGGAFVDAVVGDVTDAALVGRVVVAAEAHGPLEAAIFNAGGNWPKPFLDMDAKFFEDMWRVNAMAGFTFAQSVLRIMVPRARGTLIFTGASASTRGRANFAGFAAAKAALRAVAQSTAREFGPKGVHVAHVVVDGVIDGDRINTLMPQYKGTRPEDGLLDPDAIAENYWTLHTQPRSAWTHELDLRPWAEAW